MGFWTGLIMGLFVGAMIGALSMGLIAGGRKLAAYPHAQKEDEENIGF